MVSLSVGYPPTPMELYDKKAPIFDMGSLFTCISPVVGFLRPSQLMLLTKASNSPVSPHCRPSQGLLVRSQRRLRSRSPQNPNSSEKPVVVCRQTFDEEYDKASDCSADETTERDDEVEAKQVDTSHTSPFVYKPGTRNLKIHGLRKTRIDKRMIE